VEEEGEELDVVDEFGDDDDGEGENCIKSR
jgi:hypothetical protein